MPGLSSRAAIVVLALALAGPVGASAPDISEVTPAEALAQQILATLPDACPTEDAVIAGIESVASGADIATIAEALQLAMGARAWCAEALEAFNAAMAAAEVVMASGDAAPPNGASTTRQEDLKQETLSLRASPPGGAGGAAYGP